MSEAEKKAERLVAERDELAAADGAEASQGDGAVALRCVQMMLACKMCRRQGYVLDGFPETRKQVSAQLHRYGR